MRAPPAPFAGWRWRWLNRFAPGSVVADERRDAACAIARGLARGAMAPSPATRSSPERTELDVARFRFVTEGRPWGNPSYYACGDIVGAVLCFSGCRSDQIVNRDDDNLDGHADADPRFPPEAPTNADGGWDVRGLRAWKAGWNLTLLRQGSKEAGCWVDTSTFTEETPLPRRGDCPQVSYGLPSQHTLVLVSDPEPLDAAPGETVNEWVCTTVEGGQVNEHGQCVCTYTTFLRRDGAHLYVSRTSGGGGRVMDGYVSVVDVPLAAPALLPPDCDAGVAADDEVTP